MIAAGAVDRWSWGSVWLLMLYVRAGAALLHLAVAAVSSCVMGMGRGALRLGVGMVYCTPNDPGGAAGVVVRTDACGRFSRSRSICRRTNSLTLRLVARAASFFRAPMIWPCSLLRFAPRAGWVRCGGVGRRGGFVVAGGCSGAVVGAAAVIGLLRLVLRW